MVHELLQHFKDCLSQLVPQLGQGSMSEHLQNTCLNLSSQENMAMMEIPHRFPVSLTPDLYIHTSPPVSSKVQSQREFI